MTFTPPGYPLGASPSFREETVVGLPTLLVAPTILVTSHLPPGWGKDGMGVKNRALPFSPPLRRSGLRQAVVGEGSG